MTQEKKKPEPKIPIAKQEEQLLLGWAIANGHKDDKLYDVLDILDPADFWDIRGQIIFRAIKQVVRNGGVPDLVAVYQEIEQINKLAKEVKVDAAFLAAYSTDYTNNVPISNPITTAKRIKEIALLRKTISFFSDKAEQANKIPRDIMSFLAQSEGQFLKIIDQLKDEKRNDVIGLKQDADAQIKQYKDMGRMGYQTGIDSIDVSLTGLIPTHTWVVGAYTGTGKTFFAIQIAINVLRQGGKVAFFSLEMDRISMYLRVLGNMAGIPSMLLLEDNLTDYEKERKVEAEKELASFGDSFFLYDNAYTVEQIMIKAKRQKIKTGLDFLVLDFVQNIKGQDSIYERMSNAAVEFQSLSKDLTITTMLMSQVSNEGGKATGDIIQYKGAGELAAIADVGLWLTRIKEAPNQMELTVRKARHGISGQAYMLNVYYNQGGRIEENNKVTDDKEIELL